MSKKRNNYISLFCFDTDNKVDGYLKKLKTYTILFGSLFPFPNIMLFNGETRKTALSVLTFKQDFIYLSSYSVASETY